MEWWYYTGHLEAQGPSASPVRRTFGFEFVIFRAERGSFPTIWASHLAITDEIGRRFLYAQRLEVGDAVDRSPRVGTAPTGFDLQITGSDPSDPTTLDREPWTMTGADGADQLSASVDGVEAARQSVPPMGLALKLRGRKPAALHNGDGWIEYGPAGGSYYYSRMSMEASGNLTLDGISYQTTGSAWFDHQWGDFISVGGGGWDWFAINLDDGTDIMLYVIRDPEGVSRLMYGTLVEPGGSSRDLAGDDFTVETGARWRSPTSGADYPAAWSISIPGDDLTIDLRPTVADQELDTRATIGVIYWEGSQVVSARRNGRDLRGQAYVELTGYADSTRGAPSP
jgi:predicted secreted hydrolase